METVDLTVCVCCLVAAFNDDTSGHEACGPFSPEPLSRIAGTLDIVATVDDSTGEPVTYFSSSRCDGCGDVLAGDRHEVVAFVRQAVQ